ncbi:MAG TPA: cob(I)yrinic acid a,c-diamide adenosyltransferase [Planctomycetaceae bacterium]|nr:cob(I)yrinic acid a,c-diamide adenosyltransferase [Planctomycetaceae bacterium]
MNIYTRTGDHGETGLSDGRRVAKDCPRMELSGVLDELNSLLGMARAFLPKEGDDETIDGVLGRVQSELFLLGAEVAGFPAVDPSNGLLTDDNVTRLEQDIDRCEASLRRLTSFVVPGGSPAAAALHLARAVCRRAERRLVGLLRVEPDAVRPVGLAYLNRLSDLLFVVSRVANARTGVGETDWRPRKERNREN